MNSTLIAVAENTSLITGLILANYALAAVCAVREVVASRTSQGSIAWLVSLAFLPFPTTFVYLVLGWKHFDSYARRKHQIRQSRLIRAEELKVIDRETSAEWPVLIRSAGMPFLAGNDPELLIDGEATFESIFAGIASAQKYVLVQFYIIRDDALGQRLADALIAKAREGLSVFMLFDDVGSSHLPKAYRERLRSEGIGVAAFNQRHGLLRLFGSTRINYRNHRKNVVVDGRVAWTGGLNVGIEYLGRDPHFGHWRDTHIRIAGPAAQSFALVFREDWEWATGQMLDLGEAPLETEGDASVLLMATGPADKFEACSIAFADVIGQSRERLWVVSPYFVPDTDMRIVLYAAVLRGVDVRLMLPNKPDHMLVWLASNAHADDMVEHGVSVYRYEKGFLHQKVLLMDNRLAGVGTVNFDNRSFAINFELTAWMTDEEIVAEVQKMLAQDFTDCRQVTRDEVARRGPLSRFVAHAARLLSPVL
jgi:cardiolipin synthase